MGQPVSLLIPGNFKNLCRKLLRVRPVFCISCQGIQQTVHPLQLQRRAKKAWKYFPVPYHVLYQGTLDFFLFQKLLHGSFRAHRKRIIKCFPFLHGKIHAPAVQALLQLGKQCILICAVLVHFIYKKKSGNMIPL